MPVGKWMRTPQIHLRSVKTVHQCLLGTPKRLGNVSGLLVFQELPAEATSGKETSDVQWNIMPRARTRARARPKEKPVPLLNGVGKHQVPGHPAPGLQELGAKTDLLPVYAFVRQQKVTASCKSYYSAASLHSCSLDFGTSSSQSPSQQSRSQLTVSVTRLLLGVPQSRSQLTISVIRLLL